MRTLTHSRRQAFKNCRRRYYYQYERRLRRRDEKPGLRRGTAFGSALFALSVRKQEDGQDDPTRDWVETVVDESLTGWFEQYRWPEVNSTEQAHETEVEIVKLRALLVRYADRYGIDRRREVVYDDAFYNPATGRRSGTFRLAGKIDGLIRTGEASVRLVEDKLTSSISRVMIDRVVLDDQINEYADALIRRGYSVIVSYRHTRWPGMNPRPAGKARKVAETLEAFEQRLCEDLDERPESYFDEQIVPRVKDDLTEFRVGRWQVAQDLLLAERTGAWYQNPSKCFDFGGCQFIPLCRGDDAEDLYVVDERRNPELEEEDHGGEEQA